MARTLTAPVKSLRSHKISESRLLEFAPLATGSPRVDRERKIIFGVKVVGSDSPNTHSEPGATRGTHYTPEALREAISLYEGINVNLNHPPLDKRAPGSKFDRPAEDRLAKLFNVREVGGELYADQHLIPSHPMTESLLDAAENPKLNSCYALSHNAKGIGPVENGVWIITKITSVKSVDVVADGGTNKSLFEGREVAKQIKLRELCESAPSLKEKLSGLFKLLPTAGEMLVESEEGDDGGDYRDHLHAANKMCVDAGADVMAGKIHGLMKPKKEEEADEDESEEDASGVATEEKKGEEAEKKDKSAKAMESRMRELEGKDEARTLCESLGFAPTALQLKALIPLSKADRKEFVKELKASGPGKVRSRSLIPEPKTGGDLQESADGVPAKGEEQLAWLRG